MKKNSMHICESILSLKVYQGGKPISELQREYHKSILRKNHLITRMTQTYSSQ
jgi:hypothetical protein